MRAALLLTLLAALAGCGGETAEREAAPSATATTSESPETCQRIGDTHELCYRGGRGEHGRFLAVAGGRRTPVPVKVPREPKPNAPVIGHWAWAALSPDGRTLLAHWSAECEVPVAYLVDAEGGRPREAIPGAESSFAFGWWGDRAVVARRDGCGQPELSRLHLVGPGGVEPTRVTISDRWHREFRERVDAAHGDLRSVLRRCGIELEAPRAQTIRLASCH